MSEVGPSQSPPEGRRLLELAEVVGSSAYVQDAEWDEQVERQLRSAAQALSHTEQRLEAAEGVLRDVEQWAQLAPDDPAPSFAALGARVASYFNQSPNTEEASDAS